MIDRLKLYLRKYILPVPQPQKWVFIIGCYNSGTSLLHRILSDHEDIASLPNEGQFFTKEFPLPKELGYKRSWALDASKFYLDENSKSVDSNRVKRDWFIRFNHPYRPIYIEKTPTNAARIKWLNKHMPNAKFIAIVRNGYAVAEGINRKTGLDLLNASRQWSISNQIMLRDLEAPGIDSLLIKYEDLTSNPGEAIDRVSEFLDIAYDIERIKSSNFKIHERQSEIKNMNEYSFKSLSNEEMKLIESEARDLLLELKYQLLSQNNDQD